ncbi:retroviral-like aspartic protease family protein [Asticcacaulis sp. AND118]|uniref:retroviral-like aspartic protease family protein n=1 Tax=Asticcacaulis sp. AND118 TaxID=2840468 RepID=UPI001CFFDDCA|nr:retroviral-like aspartic protease family protein [Asticcacaulis sp. AND118]UDF02933.1 aspartyl protease family protein [Asticcacaulis sp. AND118]
MLTRRHLCAGLAAGTGLLSGPVAAQNRVVRVPLTLSASKKPIVSVRLNGKGPYRFVVDTGASRTVIRASLAAELGLSSAGQARARGLGGVEYLTRYVIAEVEVGGGLRMEEWETFGSQGYEIAAYDGLLSADLLTHLPCQLDQGRGEIRYYPSGDMPLEGFSPIDGYYRADPIGGADRIYMPLRLEGQEIDCLLDTGASMPLYLRGDRVREYGLWDRYPVTGEGRLTSVNGQKVKVRRVLMTDLRIGGLPVPRLTVTLGDPAGTHDGGAPGIVGAPFISGFVLAFTAGRTLQVKASDR